MKILMLGWELPPHNSGGLGVACYYMAKSLADLGAQIDFVLPTRTSSDQPEFMRLICADDDTDKQKLPISVKETVADASPTALGAIPSGYSGICAICKTRSGCVHQPLDEVLALTKTYRKAVLKHVKTNQPDVIHAHDWLTLEAGMAAKQVSRKPLIAHVHATEFDRAANNWGNPLIHEIEQAGLMMADRIIAVSNATKKLIVERYHIPADKIEVIYNGSAQLSSYIPSQVDNYNYLKTMQAEGCQVVISIGRLTMQKGLTFFLQAAAKANSKLDKLVFVIAGDGDQREELIAMSADLGIADRVIFLGFVRGQAWREIFELADIFVMSSVSEPFGLTALEAAQCNTASTLTKQSGVSEVLINSLKYDYWDVDKLADQLVALASSPVLKDELVSNAAAETKYMSWSKAAENIISQYQRIHSQGMLHA